jgi:hypothetical protein
VNAIEYKIGDTLEVYTDDMDDAELLRREEEEEEDDPRMGGRWREDATLGSRRN